MMLPVLQLIMRDGSLALNGATAQAALHLMLKIFYVLGALIYLLFAGIVTRQINLMRHTVETNFSGTVQLMGWVHLALAILVFVIFLLFL
jgi:hypothetical protein